jgi:hypothetical protein
MAQMGDAISSQVRFNMLKYPDMRSELIDFLGTLSAAEQTPFAPHGGSDAAYLKYYAAVDYITSYLVDDIDVTVEPEQMIGIFLYDEIEMREVAAVGNAILRYIDAERAHDPARQVLTWRDVQSASKVALAAIMARGS